MIRTPLAFFGYVKVPKEAVEISMIIQEAQRRLLKKIPDSESAKTLYELSKTITNFLRSGRLVSYKKNKYD